MATNIFRPGEVSPAVEAILRSIGSVERLGPLPGRYIAAGVSKAGSSISEGIGELMERKRELGRRKKISDDFDDMMKAATQGVPITSLKLRTLEGEQIRAKWVFGQKAAEAEAEREKAAVEDERKYEEETVWPREERIAEEEREFVRTEREAREEFVTELEEVRSMEEGYRRQADRVHKLKPDVAEKIGLSPDRFYTLEEVCDAHDTYLDIVANDVSVDANKRFAEYAKDIVDQHPIWGEYDGGIREGLAEALALGGPAGMVKALRESALMTERLAKHSELLEARSEWFDKSMKMMKEKHELAKNKEAFARYAEVAKQVMSKINETGIGFGPTGFSMEALKAQDPTAFASLQAAELGMQMAIMGKELPANQILNDEQIIDDIVNQLDFK